MEITHASHLSNEELTAAVSRLARGEREATAALIVHLAEFDRRRLYEGAGYSSLFKYCMAVLHLSEDSVYNRIETARAARRCPAIIDMLVRGALSPTTARLLARHLTPENKEELLAAASGKGKQAVEELLAHRFPQADVAASVRKLSSRAMTPAPEIAQTGASAPGAPAATRGEEAPLFASALPAAPRPVVRPLAPERYEIRFTAGAQTREKLRRAQDLLGHAVPSGDLAEVFDRALTLLVADLERKKFAATQRPRGSPGQSKDSRNVPAEVKREVVARDVGRCAFVAPNGHRCGERRFLEFHHLIPYAAGGKPTVENIQLRCRAHNGYEADLFYGPGKRRARTDVVRATAAIYGSVTERGTRSGTSDPDP
jgi:hypothetical protein